jgi:DNA-binding MarR family transcriptional regulator
MKEENNREFLEIKGFYLNVFQRVVYGALKSCEFEITTKDVMDKSKYTRPTVKKHLYILEREGIVRSRRAGTTILWSVVK